MHLRSAHHFCGAASVADECRPYGGQRLRAASQSDATAKRSPRFLAARFLDEPKKTDALLNIRTRLFLLVLFAVLVPATFVGVRVVQDDAANSIQNHREQIIDLDGRLRQARKMEAIGQLTGAIAHDFNNLLTVIVGNSELPKEHLEHDPAGLDRAEVTGSAALRGSDLTRSLFAFARRRSLVPQVTDVNELLTNTIGLLRRSLGEHIECRLALDPDVWLAMIDRTQLTTAILNLAVNARDAMSLGGRLVLETANVKFDGVYAERQQEVRPGDDVMIAVTDSGTGMNPETSTSTPKMGMARRSTLSAAI